MSVPIRASPTQSVEFDLPCVKCRYNVRGCLRDAPCPECATPIFESLAAAGQLGQLGPAVDFDRACVQCSYNLRGLSTSGKCPECGMSVEHSLRGFLLQFAAPPYLAAVHRGLGLILGGILLMIVLYLANIGFMFGGGGMALGSSSSVAWVLLRGAQLVPSLMILFGYWKYTQPDPGFVGAEVPVSARRVIRVAVIIQSSGVVAGFCSLTPGSAGLFSGLGTPLREVLEIGVWVVLIGGYIAWAFQFFANMRYTRWIASRIPDSAIVRRTRRYTWLLPVLVVSFPVLIVLMSTTGSSRFLGIGGMAGMIVWIAAMYAGLLLALVLYWNLLDRVRRHLKRIRLAVEIVSA